MKRLLSGGLEKIFQMAPAFRDEPGSPHHLSQFTMLEWYRAFCTDQELMVDTETLIEHLALEVHGAPQFRFGDQELHVARPWPRYTVQELFEAHAGLDLKKLHRAEDFLPHLKRLQIPLPSSEDSPSWDTLYYLIWLNAIEPKLPRDRAFFIHRYPASQAALSVIDTDPDGSRWARRFEAYLGQTELANAFEELTDPVEQRARFEADMKLRTLTYGRKFPASPIDEEFLLALEEGLPPSAGIALGLERLVQILADEPEIGFCHFLPVRFY